MNATNLSDHPSSDIHELRPTVPVPPPERRPERLPEDIATRLIELKLRRESIEAEEARLAAELLDMMIAGGMLAITTREGDVQRVPCTMRRFVDADKAEKLLRSFGVPVPMRARFDEESLVVQIPSAQEDEEPPTARACPRAKAS